LKGHILGSLAESKGLFGQMFELRTASRLDLEMPETVIRIIRSRLERISTRTKLDLSGFWLPQAQLDFGVYLSPRLVNGWPHILSRRSVDWSAAVEEPAEEVDALLTSILPSLQLPFYW